MPKPRHRRPPANRANEARLYVPPLCTEDIRTLYADDDILVVVKPAGLLSVPGIVNKDCLVTRVQADYPGARIVHRLDLDTSGIMVLARTQHAVADINRQFRERSIDKRYEAIVYGELTGDGSINLALSPDPDNRPKQRIDLDGKDALTRFEVLEPGATSRVVLLPTTGRSHQLRVHLAAIDHPILGCDLYAHAEALAMSDRLQLHATGLTIDHPGSGERTAFSDPVPF
jgi:tRNA pseudouridine32 synthase/23S rRNA pseudouridine746 synthase